MKRFFRGFTLTLTVLALCMPIGLMVVYLLYPLWSWLETRFGIEAIGHGGPAAWCYVAVYVLVVMLAGGMILFAKHRGLPREKAG